MDLKKQIRVIEDFPKKGISYKDITTIIEEPKYFKYVINKFEDEVKNLDYNKVVGIEARGFIFASPISYNQEKPLVIIRKPNKLPFETITATYDLEYGSDTLQMHIDSIKEGDRVILIDDLLATGGTSKAAIELVEKKKATVAAVLFIVELTDLKGREKLKGYNVKSLVEYNL